MNTDLEMEMSAASYIKLNSLDANGFFIRDYFIGADDTPLPEYWTATLVGDGYYKAQYQNFVRNTETGECTSGTWVEMGSPPAPDYLALAKAELAERLTLSNFKIAVLTDATDPDIMDEIDPADVAALKLWKKYRVLLTKLDLSTAPNINWPVQPA